jgi:hypothetical protein
MVLGNFLDATPGGQKVEQAGSLNCLRAKK